MSDDYGFTPETLEWARRTEQLLKIRPFSPCRLLAFFVAAVLLAVAP